MRRMMHAGNRERGITFLGLITILVVLSFVGLIGLKMFPIYLESFKIDKAMKSVVAQPDVASMDKLEIARALTRRLDIDSVRQITERNYLEYVTITKKENKVAIDVRYRAEAKLFANISVVVDFEKHVES